MVIVGEKSGLTTQAVRRLSTVQDGTATPEAEGLRRATIGIDFEVVTKSKLSCRLHEIGKAPCIGRGRHVFKSGKHLT
jgi:hypothetical protein